MSRFMIVHLTLGAALLTGVGCSLKSEEEKTKQAILFILREDKRIHEATIEQQLRRSDATPSQLAQAIANYCAQAEALNLSSCPADFRVAYRHHIHAWRKVQAAVQELLDGFLEGVFIGFFNSLLRGELDGGVSRLLSNVENAEKQVEATWMEVEKIAAKYGAAL